MSVINQHNDYINIQFKTQINKQIFFKIIKQFKNTKKINNQKENSMQRSVLECPATHIFQIKQIFFQSQIKILKQNKFKYNKQIKTSNKHLAQSKQANIQNHKNCYFPRNQFG
ncbi:hypothetical protein ABPG72_003335 [Tetrahymena utriculariae]